MENNAPISFGQTFFETDATVAHPDLSALLAIWKSWRGDAAMPGVDVIKPRAMMAYLSRIQLYDVMNEGTDFRVRLVGTGIAQAFGHDLTGTLISQHPNRARGERLMAALTRVAATAQPLHMKTAEEMRERYETRHIESLWLPFGSGGTVELVLAQSILKIHAPYAPKTAGAGA